MDLKRTWNYFKKIGEPFTLLPLEILHIIYIMKVTWERRQYQRNYRLRIREEEKRCNKLRNLYHARRVCIPYSLCKTVEREALNMVAVYNLEKGDDNFYKLSNKGLKKLMMKIFKQKYRVTAITQHGMFAFYNDTERQEWMIKTYGTKFLEYRIRSYFYF